MSPHLPSRRGRQAPMQSLVAAARQVTGSKIGRQSSSALSEDSWQDEGWAYYEACGELRYAAQHVARSLSRATLHAAQDPPGAAEPVMIDPSDPDQPAPTPIQQAAADLVADFGGGTAGQSTLLQRLGVLLFIPGEAYIVGVSADPDDPMAPRQWMVASPDEVATDRDGRVTLSMGDGSQSYDPDDVLLTRVWNPHPRRWWEADSPTRSARNILRELVGLHAHIEASVESRLAGAGVLVIPNSVTFAGNPEDTPDGEDPFVEGLIEAMVTPIKDRDSAAAVVPLVVRVPDEVAASGGLQHLTFSTPFDKETQQLQEDAIKRLGIALDVPPEVLSGVAGANHWSAWSINEDTVRTHIEPMLAVVCDALSVGYIRPALIAMGFAPEDADQMVVWFSTANLMLRPSRSQDAQAAHAAGVITDAALREALGFSTGDAPLQAAVVDPAVQAVLHMVEQAPSLATDPGLPKLLADVRKLLQGEEGPDADVAEAIQIQQAEEPDPDGTTAVPDTNGQPAVAAASVGYARFLQEGGE